MKAGIIILVIVVLAAIGAGVWYMMRPEVSPTNTNTTNSTPTNSSLFDENDYLDEALEDLESADGLTP